MPITRHIHLSSVLMGLLVLPGVAIAGDLQPETARWLPGVGLSVGLEVQDFQADSSTDGLFPPFQTLTEASPLRPPSEGDVLSTATTVSIDYSLMSPSFVDSLGKPRFFAHGNIQLNLASDVVPATEGARGEVVVPVDASGQQLSVFTAETVLGQGTRMNVKHARLQFRAGAGLAFTTDIGDQRFRFKPSVEYLRNQIEISGGATRVVQLPGTGATINRLDSTTVRIESVDLIQTRTLHGIGPGFEIEFDARRAGPLMLTLFSGFKAYYFIGDLENDLVGTTSAGETVQLHFEYDRWAYRTEVGFRFRWQPR
ncbi:MAG TPA: hypothetical protein ENI85_09550 [Deltaproteobacteria bacterium]|nr:hypothetical protein [Deltaproteobacteria bacterium]